MGDYASDKRLERVPLLADASRTHVRGIDRVLLEQLLKVLVVAGEVNHDEGPCEYRMLQITLSQRGGMRHKVRLEGKRLLPSEREAWNSCQTFCAVVASGFNERAGRVYVIALAKYSKIADTPKNQQDRVDLLLTLLVDMLLCQRNFNMSELEREVNRLQKPYRERVQEVFRRLRQKLDERHTKSHRRINLLIRRAVLIAGQPARKYFYRVPLVESDEGSGRFLGVSKLGTEQEKPDCVRRVRRQGIFDYFVLEFVKASQFLSQLKSWLSSTCVTKARPEMLAEIVAGVLQLHPSLNYDASTWGMVSEWAEPAARFKGMVQLCLTSRGVHEHPSLGPVKAHLLLAHLKTMTWRSAATSEVLDQFDQAVMSDKYLRDPTGWRVFLEDVLRAVTERANQVGRTTPFCRALWTCCSSETKIRADASTIEEFLLTPEAGGTLMSTLLEGYFTAEIPEVAPDIRELNNLLRDVVYAFSLGEGGKKWLGENLSIPGSGSAWPESFFQALMGQFEAASPKLLAGISSQLELPNVQDFKGSLVEVVAAVLIQHPYLSYDVAVGNLNSISHGVKEGFKARLSVCLADKELNPEKYLRPSVVKTLKAEWRDKLKSDIAALLFLQINVCKSELSLRFMQDGRMDFLWFLHDELVARHMTYMKHGCPVNGVFERVGRCLSFSGIGIFGPGSQALIKRDLAELKKALQLDAHRAVPEDLGAGVGAGAGAGSAPSARPGGR